MPRSPISSTQTKAILQELAGRMPAWQHGYDLAKSTGLKSGTLYPMLARLAEHGFLETAWEEAPPVGRPRRHLYRLTPEGVSVAAELQSQQESVRRPQLAGRRQVRASHAG